MENSKDLYDYWYGRVQLRNHDLIAAARHVKTFELRHECTNYNDLWRSLQVQQLDEPERSKIIAIIKYECTAKVLQQRAGRLRDRSIALEEACQQRDQQQSGLRRLVKALQEKLFGKDREIQQLQTRIASLQAENEALRTEAEKGKAEAELRTELAELKKRYDVVEKRRQELAQNNKSLGGRVAHTNRYRQQRDEAKILVEQQKNQIETLVQENHQLHAENERLYQELKRVQA